MRIPTYRKKIIGGFWVIVLAVLVVSTVLLHAFREVINSHQQTEHSEVTRLSLLKDLRLAVTNKISSSHRYFLTEEREEREAAARWGTEVQNILRWFSGDTEDAELLKLGTRLRDADQAHSAVMNRIIDFGTRSGGALGGVPRELITVEMARATELSGITDKLIDLQEENTHRAERVSRNSESAALLQIVLVGGFTILAAAVLSFLLLRANARLDEARSKLQHFAFDQAAIARLGRMAVETVTTDPGSLRRLATTAASLVRERTGASFVEILSVEPHVAMPAMTEQYTSLACVPAEAPGLAGLTSGSIFTLGLTQSFLTAHPSMVEKLGSRGSLTVPLDSAAGWTEGTAKAILTAIPGRAISVGAVSGLIGAYWSSPNDDRRDHSKFTTKIADVLGPALQRWRIESALQSSEAHVKLLMNSTAEGILGIDPSGICTFANTAALRFLGYTNESELVGKNQHQLMHYQRPDGSPFPESDCLAHKAFKSTESIHVESDVFWRADGTALDVEYWVEPMWKDGVYVGAVQTFSDITERTRALARERFLSELSLGLSRSLDYPSTLQTVVQMAIREFADCSAIFFQDPDLPAIAPTLIQTASRYPEKEAILRELAADSPLTRAKVLQNPLAFSLQTQKPVLITNIEAYENYVSDEWHLERLRAMGPRSLITVPLIARDKLRGVLLFLRGGSRKGFDRQDLKLAEEVALRAAWAIDNALLYRTAQEALATRDEFLSIASHELKTPLTSLLLQLQMIQRLTKKAAEDCTGPLQPNGVSRLVDGAEKQSLRLGQMLEELLDLTRIRASRIELNRERFDLGALAREVIERLDGQAKQAGSPVALEVFGPVEGSWDRNRTDQIMTNLLSNAIKYGAGKPIQVIVNKANGRARIEIRDQGIGIPLEQQPRIFERFERGSAKGSKIAGLGLGLFISAQLVRLHAGQIGVSSMPGAGSTFFVELPLEARDLPAGQRTAESPPQSTV